MDNIDNNQLNIVIYDAQLVEGYLGGDEGALGLLVGRYLKSVYSFVYKYVGNAHDAEDIVQDVFVKVWKSLGKFDKEKSFKTWVFTIAKNSCIDFMKKHKSIPFSAFEGEDGENLIEELKDEGLSPQDLLEKKDIAKMLSLAVENLTLKYREVLSLRYNEDFTFKEIAQSLGESIDTVKSRHRRALMMLRKVISGDILVL